MKPLPLSRYSELPAVEIICPSCGEGTEGFVFSRAFSTSEEVICDRCGVQWFLEDLGPLFDHMNAEAKREGKTVHTRLRPCTCGGRFVSANFRFDLYHCPTCSEPYPTALIEKTLGIQGATGTRTPYEGHPVGHPEVSSTWPGLLLPSLVKPERPEDIWDLSSPGSGFTEVLQEERRYLAELKKDETARREKKEKQEKEVTRIREQCAKGSPPDRIQYGPKGFTFQLVENGEHFPFDPTPLIPSHVLSSCEEWEANCQTFEDIRSQYADHRMEAPTARNSCPSFDEHIWNFALIERELTQSLGDRCDLTLKPYPFNKEEETYTRIAFEHYQIPPPVLCLYQDGIFLKLSRYTPWRVAFKTNKMFPGLFLHAHQEWASLAEYLEAVECGYCIQSNPNYMRWALSNPSRRDLESLESHLKDFLTHWMKLDSCILFERHSTTRDRERADSFKMLL